MTRSLRRLGVGFFLTLSLVFNCHAQETEKCVSTLADLKLMLGDSSFSLNWEETTMDDGKPLVVTISEKNGALSVAFVKRTKGLWADITGEICQTGKEMEIRFTGQQIQFGPAASWILRYVLGNGGKFTLTKIDAKTMRVATMGWSGIFAQVEK